MRLLGVLLSIGLALGLTVYVVDRVGGEQRAVLEDTPTPGASGEPAVPAIPAASAAACAANRQALATAEEAYDAVHGHYADLPTLVAEGVIREPSVPLTIRVAPDGRSFTVEGDCP